MASAQRLLIEGLTDATGFLAGALLGYGSTLALQLNVFAPGYDAASIAGMVLIGIGGGIGLQLARRWRPAAARARTDHP